MRSVCILIVYLSIVSGCTSQISLLTSGTKKEVPATPDLSICEQNNICSQLISKSIAIFSVSSDDGPELSNTVDQNLPATVSSADLVTEDGFYGSKLKYTGSDGERAVFSDNTNLSATSLAVSFWFNVDQGSHSSFVPFVTKHSGTSSRSGFMIGFTYKYHGGMGFVPWLQMKDGANNISCETKTKADDAKDYDDGKWHHVAANLNFTNGETSELYVDGVLFDTCVLSSTVDSTGFDLIIGDSPDSYWGNYAGSLDEIYVLDSPLTSSEIEFLSQYSLMQ